MIKNNLYNLLSPVPQLLTVDKVQTCAPVEVKGYKNILDLPDWLNEQCSFVKSGKSYRKWQNLSFISCPFSLVRKEDTYEILLVTVRSLPAVTLHALVAGCSDRRDCVSGRRRRWNRTGAVDFHGKDERGQSSDRTGRNEPLQDANKLPGGLYSPA